MRQASSRLGVAKKAGGSLLFGPAESGPELGAGVFCRASDGHGAAAAAADVVWLSRAQAASGLLAWLPARLRRVHR